MLITCKFIHTDWVIAFRIIKISPKNIIDTLKLGHSEFIGIMDLLRNTHLRTKRVLL